jgi:hypothetical protein
MRRLLLAAVVAVSACDSPGITGNDCSGRYACQVEGVDLAVVSATVDSTAPHYGAVVVDPSNVTIRFVVLNRGDKTSSSGVSVEAGVFGHSQTVTIGPVAPGDSAIGMANFSIDRAYLIAGEELEAENAFVRVLASDAVAENNVLAGPRVLLTIPFLSLAPVIMPPQTVRIGQPITTWFSLQFGFSAYSLNKRIDVLVCLRASDRTCTQGNWRPMLRLDDIASGRFAQVPLNAEAAPSPSAGIYQLIYCAVPADYAGTYLEPDNPDHHCRAAGVVTIVP